MAAKILVVDDEPGIVAIIRDILTLRGHHVVSACTGKEALEKLEKEDIDLVVMDIMMPVMDGIRACDKMKHNPKTASIPVIMLTVRQDMDSRLDAVGVYVDEYLTKPFDTEILVEKVNEHLERIGKGTGEG